MTLGDPRGFIHRYDEDTEGIITEELPFRYAWKDPHLHIEGYDKLMIAPVTLEYLEEDEWKSSRSSFVRSKKAFDKKAKKLAAYADKVFRKKFEKSGLEIVNEPGPTTLLLEIAFTEIVFGKPVVYSAAFAVPLPGVSYVFDSASSPKLSFEARIVDSETEISFAEAADRKLPRVKPFDLNKFTVSSTLREVVTRWADELVRSFHRKDDKKVKATSSFSLIPW